VDRRNFLKAAGVAPAAALAAPELAHATGPFLDTEQLAYRNNNRSTVACQNGIVCASQPLAAMVGIDILKAGGNCIDAAIAVNATLGLTEPHMNGVGGDLFAIVWSERDRRLLLYEITAADAFPIMGALSKLPSIEEYDSRLLCGESTLAPRLTSVPVRIPQPSPEDFGSIYELQRNVEKPAFQSVSNKP